ncbi:hypothetical protein ABT352_15685, partial [Streptosporangium sp. NPDC000563]|uniref:hypothetical protein n=1 Tax=Streptosporangium sp. NPDC000563 TaxID=3154366 RepID=UPI00332EFC3F
MPDTGQRDTGDPKALGHDTTEPHASASPDLGQAVPTARQRLGWIAAVTACVALGTLVVSIALFAIFWPSTGLFGYDDVVDLDDTIEAVAVGQINGQPIAVTDDYDGTMQVWDLTTYKPIGEPMTGHTEAVQAMAISEVDGRP